MEAVVTSLRAIELEHRWWSPEIFLRLENETLRRKVKEVLQSSPYRLWLATHGTSKDIQEFADSLHERTPLIIISALTCFLDSMFQQETSKIPVSAQIIGWYRQQGWDFPQFKCEIT
jgi:hypothetical protein